MWDTVLGASATTLSLLHVAPRCFRNGTATGGDVRSGTHTNPWCEQTSLPSSTSPPGRSLSPDAGGFPMHDREHVPMQRRRPQAAQCGLCRCVPGQGLHPHRPPLTRPRNSLTHRLLFLMYARPVQPIFAMRSCEGQPVQVLAMPSLANLVPTTLHFCVFRL